MTPYEIMLSESQERMLLVAQKGREEEVFRVFEKLSYAMVMKASRPIYIGDKVQTP